MSSLDIIEINDKIANNARVLASGLSEPNIRKRGLVDLLGVNCAINYFQSKRLKVDTKRSVYNIPILFEEFKITDIYYNNYRIDVITLYREKTIKIPKIQVDVDILPDFYFVIQIGAKIKEAKMIGFIEGKSILGSSCDSKFYYPTLDLIFDLRKFLNITKHSTPTRTVIGKHANCLGLFLKFIDNDLSNVYKSQMIQHIMNCDSCRSRFIDAMEFEKVARNIRHYPELMKKYEYKIQTADIPVLSGNVNSLEEKLNRIENENNVQQRDGDFVEEAQEEDFEEPQGKYTKNRTLGNISRSKNLRETLSKNKKVIDAIFKEIRNIEIPQIKTVIKSKHKHKIIVIAIMLVALMTFALISVKNMPSLREENEFIEQMQNDADDISEFDMLYGSEENPSHQARLIPKQRNIEAYMIQPPVQSNNTYNPSVKSISWEVPESLVKKDDYTNFLQLAGKSIKLNLQNELLLVRDIPVNRLVSINLKINSSGDVQSVKLVQTSGSGRIDSAINKVIKDTLRYMKPPAHGIISRSVNLTLTIELI